MTSMCQREPRQPHLTNCPALIEKRTGAYLRRPRERNGTCWLPHIVYLVETRPEPDSPAALYRQDNEV